jgi:hypothetical protein
MREPVLKSTTFFTGSADIFVRNERSERVLLFAESYGGTLAKANPKEVSAARSLRTWMSALPVKRDSSCLAVKAGSAS